MSTLDSNGAYPNSFLSLRDEYAITAVLRKSAIFNQKKDKRKQ